MFSWLIRRVCASAAMCVPLAVAGCSEAPAAPEAPPPKVTVQHCEERELVDYLDYNGWTAASKTVEIRSRVRGHIDKVHFTDGQLVEVGDLLFVLDPRPFQVEIDRANGQATIAKAQQEFAAAEVGRQTELLEKKATSKSEYERAVASYKQWDAQVGAALEEVKRKELDMEYSRITAPIAGKIGRALLDAGNLVNAGGTDPVMTTIVAIDPIHVYFFVDERALLQYRQRNTTKTARRHEKPLKESQIPFEFGLETDEGYPHKGNLDFANNRIDPQTGTIEVRGEADNADSRFLPGSRVRVRIPISEPYRASLVPDTAVLSDQDKRYLLCLNPENVVVRRNVRLGRLLEDGMRVILTETAETEALTPDDWVIVLGLQRARVNYPVEPLDVDGKPISRSGT
jgi:RND family efflux transporter MFP subunit